MPTLPKVRVGPIVFSVALSDARQKSGDLTTATVPAGRFFPPCHGNSVISYACYAVAFFVDRRLFRCRMTASFRATATLAWRRPFRLVSLVPQAFSPDYFGTRVSSTPAASNRYMRNMASPHFEIRPDQSISPEAWRLVVNPI